MFQYKDDGLARLKNVNIYSEGPYTLEAIKNDPAEQGNILWFYGLILYNREINLILLKTYIYS